MMVGRTGRRRVGMEEGSTYDQIDIKWKGVGRRKGGGSGKRVERKRKSGI